MHKTFLLMTNCKYLEIPFSKHSLEKKKDAEVYLGKNTRQQSENEFFPGSYVWTADPERCFFRYFDENGKLFHCNLIAENITEQSLIDAGYAKLDSKYGREDFWTCDLLKRLDQTA